MNRDSVVFYLSFYEAIKELPEMERLKAFEMVFDYAFKGVEPTDNGIALAIFKLVKPQIDANNKRYENGKKPKQNGSKTEAKPKQSGSETEANSKQNISESEANVNVNDNVNVNANDNDNANDNANANVNANDKDIGSDEPPHISKSPTKHHYGEYKHVLLTDEEYKKLVQERGQAKTEAAITFLDEYLEMNGKSYKSCYLALRKWVFDAVDKQSNTKTVGNESAYQRDREWAEEMQAMQERGELNGF